MRRRLPAVLAVLGGLASAQGAVAASPPSVSGPSAIVVEASTGDVAYQRAPDAPRPIASATKLMTALLALERSELGAVVPAARYRALPVESKINLRPGERMTMADLLRALMIESANDAAVTIAEHVSGSRARFVRDMNARARELGLENTSFANPIGLDAPGNRSTARDLALLTLRLREFPFFRRTTNRAQVTLASGSRPRTLANRNRLVRRVPWIDGVKTGHTLGAGYVLVGSGRRNGVSLISVVLGTPSEAAREADTLALLKYGFTRYRRERPVNKGHVYTRVPIRFREGAQLELMAGRSVTKVVRRGTRLRVSVLGAPAEVVGPIERGERFGTVRVSDPRGATVAEVPLVAAAAVPAAGVAERSKDYFTRPLTILLVLVVIAAATSLVVLRRRVHRGAGRHGREGWAA